jgi:hypothetical protein
VEFRRVRNWTPDPFDLAQGRGEHGRTTINTFEGDAFGIKVSLVCSDLALAPASCLLPHAFRLLSHFIRPRQHIRWDCQADLLGGLQIDD